MLVKSITEEEIYGIGHAFGYYDYEEETGMAAAFSGKEATGKLYLCLCARSTIKPKGVLPGPSSVTELPFFSFIEKP